MEAAPGDRDQDVPSPIDLRDPHDASAWVAAADRTRPWRTTFRSTFADLLAAATPTPERVLELGAGPGLLADAILQACPGLDYTLFDFSPAMLNMAREQLALRGGANFVHGDFKISGWTELVRGPFDAVVAMQAIHEIRHKRHVPGLYQQIRALLRPRGLLLVCDHSPPDGSARFTSLHSTESEQHAALRASGFVEVRTELVLNGMYLCAGTSPRNAG
jgi:SAM-dependent methyltransferase